MMSIDEAKELLRRGATFGSVFPEIAPVNQAALRWFFCHKLVHLRQPVVASATSFTSLSGATGEVCPRCQGGNVKKTGTCSVCMDCGESVGGCS